MTIASLIVDIAANTVQLQKDVQKIQGQFDGLVSMSSKIAGAFGIAFSAQAVIGFTKALMDDADALTKLEAKTAISITGLQRMQVAGDDAGNTLDQLTSASVRLSKGIAEGNSSTVGGLRLLGLTLDDLKGIGPEKQFYAISDAIRKVQDPLERVRIATELFGKAGADVLPTLMRGFDDVRDAAVGMSDDTAHALGDAGDTLQAWWRSFQGYAADIIVWSVRVIDAGFNPMKYQLNELQRLTEQTDQQIKGMIASVPTPKGFTAPELPKIGETEIKAFNRDLEETARRQQKAASEAKHHADELKQLQARVVEMGFAMRRTMGEEFDTSKSSSAFIRDIDAIKAKLQEIDNVRPGAKGIQQFGTAVLEVQPPLGTFGHMIDGAALKMQNLAKSPKDFASGFKSAANVVSTILDNIGGKAAEVAEIVARTVETAIEKFSQGDWIGGTVALVTGGISAIKKLFHDAEKDVNPVRQAFVDAAGGLAELDRRAHGAGVTLRAMLDAKTPEAYKKAIDDLNKAMEFQDQAMRTLEETAQKYNLTVEEMGPAWSRQQLEKKAGELYQDFQVLTSAGVGVDTVLSKMGGSINDFVHDALRTGTEIPAAMAPMLQRMVEMGTLTDANGNVITDLEQAGVHFSLTMTEGFQKIVEAVGKLTDAITRGLGLAIENIPDPEVTGHVGWDVDPIPASGTYQNDWEDRIPAMATGGVVSRPTVALIGEQGPEAVVPLSRLESMRGGSKVVNFAEMRDEIRALRAETARVSEYYESGQFAKDQARAMRDESMKRVAVRR